MNNRIANATCVILGIVFMFISVRSLLHHQYEYYNRVKQMWIPSFLMLLVGAWFVIYGLIALVRGGELHPQAPLEHPPLNTPNPIPRPDEAEQEQPDEESKKSGTIPLSMFGRGR
jgi:hypothetical protein